MDRLYQGVLQAKQMFAHGGRCFVGLAMDNRGHDFMMMVVVDIDPFGGSGKLTQMLPAWLTPDGINGIKKLFDAIDAVRREPGWQHLRELARTPERVDVYNDHHHKIMSAIIHRQPNEAAAAMREHLLSLQNALIQAIHLEDDITL